MQMQWARSVSGIVAALSLGTGAMATDAPRDSAAAPVKTSKEVAPVEASKADAVRPVPANGTISFVLTGWRPAVYDKDTAKGCPQGLNVNSYAQYRKQFPGLVERAIRETQFSYVHANRGPNGENVDFNPELVVDPIPFKLSLGPYAFGVDLDGKVELASGGFAPSILLTRVCFRQLPL